MAVKGGIGSRRHRVEVQEPGELVDEFNKKVPAWPPHGGQVLGRRWMSIEWTAGSESVDAAQVKASRSCIVRLRYMRALTTKHRFRRVSDGLVLNIESIAPIDDIAEDMVLNCKTEG